MEFVTAKNLQRTSIVTVVEQFFESLLLLLLINWVLLITCALMFKFQDKNRLIATYVHHTFLGRHCLQMMRLVMRCPEGDNKSKKNSRIWTWVLHIYVTVIVLKLLIATSEIYATLQILYRKVYSYAHTLHCNELKIYNESKRFLYACN